MKNALQEAMANVHSGDGEIEGQGYRWLMDASEAPVDWAYAIWDDLVSSLDDPDNHVRAIAGQVLCNLAKSDPEARMLHDFEKLLDATRDKRFVTARHILQNLYKVGAPDAAHQQMLLSGYERRYFDCVDEKNGTLIRYDIIVGMRDLYNLAPDEDIRALAKHLIEQEPSEKYRKKYATVWKK